MMAIMFFSGIVMGVIVLAGAFTYQLAKWVLIDPIKDAIKERKSWK